MSTNELLDEEREITNIVHSSHSQKYDDSPQSQKFNITPEDDNTDCTAQSNEWNGVAQEVNSQSLA